MAELDEAAAVSRLRSLKAVHSQLHAFNPSRLLDLVTSLVEARQPVAILDLLVELNMANLLAFNTTDLLAGHIPLIGISASAVIRRLDNISAHQDGRRKLPDHREALVVVRAVLVVVSRQSVLRTFVRHAVVGNQEDLAVVWLEDERN